MAGLAVGEHAHLHGHLTVAGDHQGRLDGEFFEPSARDAASCVQGELYESRARQDDRAVHRVITQPRNTVRRQHSREHSATTVAEFDRRTEHRVSPVSMPADATSPCGTELSSQ